MIPKACKRLAKVEFPITEVSKHTFPENSIRPSHPLMFHQWWVKRPLAAAAWSVTLAL